MAVLFNSDVFYTKKSDDSNNSKTVITGKHCVRIEQKNLLTTMFFALQQMDVHLSKETKAYIWATDTEYMYRVWREEA